MVTDKINKNKEKYFPVQFKNNARGKTIASTYAELQKQILNIFGSQMSEIFSFWSMKTDNNFKLLMMELEIFYFWPSIQQTCHSSG